MKDHIEIRSQKKCPFRLGAELGHKKLCRFDELTLLVKTKDCFIVIFRSILIKRNI